MKLRLPIIVLIVCDTVSAILFLGMIRYLIFVWEFVVFKGARIESRESIWPSVILCLVFSLPLAVSVITIRKWNLGFKGIARWSVIFSASALFCMISTEAVQKPAKPVPDDIKPLVDGLAKLGRTAPEGFSKYDTSLFEISSNADQKKLAYSLSAEMTEPATTTYHEFKFWGRDATNVDPLIDHAMKESLGKHFSNVGFVFVPPISISNRVVFEIERSGISVVQ